MLGFHSSALSLFVSQIIALYFCKIFTRIICLIFICFNEIKHDRGSYS